MSEKMNNKYSFSSNRKIEMHSPSSCHSKTKVNSHYIDGTHTPQPVKPFQVPILDSQHKHQILDGKSKPSIKYLNRNSNVESGQKIIRKEYFFRIEDDLFNVTNHLEKNPKYETVEIENSIDEQVPSSNSCMEKEHIKLQNSVKEEYNINPSSDSLAITTTSITTSQILKQDCEVLSSNSSNNIHEAKIHDYAKVEYSPSKEQEKHMFVLQENKSQAFPVTSFSLDNHKALTFKDTIEKNIKHIKLKKVQCNLDISHHNDNEPQTLNFDARNVCKVWSPKIEKASLQSKDEVFINAGSCFRDEKSNYDKPGMLVNKKPPSNEKELIAHMHKAKEEKEASNFRNNIRRSSRVPKLKRYPEEVFENVIDDSSPGRKIQHAMKNKIGSTGELWECKNCDAMFRSHNSLKSHHASCHSFICYMCNWQGSMKTEYETHMSTKHFKQADNCLVCREEFSNYDQYREHMINVHKTIFSSNCDSNATVKDPQQAYPKSCGTSNVENMRFSDNSQILDLHEDIHQSRNDISRESNEYENHLGTSTGNKKCPYCPKSFMRQSRLVRHLNYHLGKKSFACNLCKKSFVEKSGLDAHMVTHNPVNAACKHCDKVFKTQRTLKRHLQTHKNKTYVCDICNKVFHHVESLRVHKLTHNEGGSGNTCDICNKDCKTPYYLQVHLKTKHGSAKFECKDCHKFFKWKQSFNKHMNRFHDYPDDQLCSEPASDNLTSKSKFKCEECSRPHSSMSDLMKHQESHKKEMWSCDRCGKHFKHLYTRDKHIKMVHDASDEQECPQCDATFKNKAYLDQHITHVHTSNDRVKCGLCENDFKTKANLRSHVKTVHGQKENRHTCEECDKSFASPKDLSRHQKVHTRVQEFECPVCHRLFSRKDNMTAHLRTHTDATSGSPTKSFSSESLHLLSDEISPKIVHKPISFTLQGNDIKSNSQTSPDIVSQSQIRIPSLSSKLYNNSFSSSITSISRMPYQMITTVSSRLPMDKDTPTSKPPCILTVPKASFSSPPSNFTGPNFTNNTSPYVSVPNGSFSIIPSLALTSSPPTTSLITLTSSSTSSSSSLSRTSSLITLASSSSSSSLSYPDASIEVKVLPDHQQALEHPELQQDHVVIAHEILPLLSPTEAHFNEPHVVYILEDGSFRIGEPDDIKHSSPDPLQHL